MIFLVTALQSEAKPLAKFFRLVGSDATSPYRLYRRSDIVLVVSGMGRVASAAATAYAFAHTGEPRDSAWINVGIAGHSTVEVGSCRLASKIHEPSSGRSWYPSLIVDSGIEAAEVVTVDRLERDFERDALYEMEASAFFSIASRLTPIELVQVLKVVSDNRSQPASSLQPVDVSHLIEAQTETIGGLVEMSRELGAELAARGQNQTPEIDSWIADHHLTVSQRRRLVVLLRRIAVLEGRDSFSPNDLGGTDHEHATDLLRALEERLERSGVGY